jgi:polyhydroxybutyrate depolymerase
MVGGRHVFGLLLLAVTAEGALFSSRGSAAPQDTAVYLPHDYSRDRAWPLVILLHGSQATGDMQDLHLGLSERVTRKGVILAVPEKTTAGDGMTSTDQLDALIASLKRSYSIDAARTFLIGHSMGGYQALAFACARPGVVAGVVASAAVDPCEDGTAPTRLLLATGDADLSDRLVDATTASWREINGCRDAPSRVNGLDLQWDVAGAESSATRWTGCADDASIVSLRSRFGRHVPIFRGAMADAMLEFLLHGDLDLTPFLTGNCVAEGDDRGRYLASDTEVTSARTTVAVREYADAACSDLKATVTFSGPGGQASAGEVAPLAFETVQLEPASASVVDALNGSARGGAFCGTSWRAGTALSLSGRDDARRLACMRTMGEVTGTDSLVKRLVLSYLFAPALPE